MEPSAGHGVGDVAIVGMACVFPGAADARAFWANIVGGVDAIGDPPDWDPEFVCDPQSSANDRVYTRRGGYLGDLLRFDPVAYGVMPRTVDGGEPEHFAALRLADEALADAGYRDREFPRHRTGIILGRGTYVNRGMIGALQHGVVVDQTVRVIARLHPEYSAAELARLKEQLKAQLPPFNAETAQSLAHSAMCGRIANRLDLMGPAYTVDAACASSLIAVDCAMKELWQGSCDLALAGGIQVSTSFPIAALFCQLGALSRSGRLRPFHPDADGTLLGEGAGVLVLKRLPDAERDGDRIYAVVRSVGIASDGRAMGVLAPRVEGEELSMRRAYERVAIAPASIGLVEAHGTGTPAGDATEIEALHRVFGARRGEVASCALGSVKSMIGHSIPAAGVAGLIKAALAVYYKVLPPTLHAQPDDPRLAGGPFYLNGAVRPWIHGGEEPRRAGVNAFGFGGINAHAILEEQVARTGGTRRSASVPAPTSVTPAPRDSELFVLEADSRHALLDRVTTVRRLLDGSPTLAMSDLAYTLAAARVPESAATLAVVAASRDELGRKLAHAGERLADPDCGRIKDRSGIYFFAERLGDAKVAFLFPGEGSQYPGMLADLCLHFPEVRAWFDRMDRAIRHEGRETLPSQVVFPPHGTGGTVGERLWEMKGAVEAVFTADQALHALLTRFAIRPQAIVGHSSGEYAALLAAGAAHTADEEQFIGRVRAMNRVGERATERGLVAQAPLLAVGVTNPEVLRAVLERAGDQLYLAMDNCPRQVVVSGSEEAVAAAHAELRAAGMMCQRLPFDRGYHTPLFAPFCEELRTFFDEIRFVSPPVAYFSCVTAAPVAEPAEIRRLAVEQWARPVRFRETVEALYASGVRVFVEVGPRGNLTAFVDDILGKRPRVAVALDVPKRPGLTQLQHVLGLLVAHGVPLTLEPLFEGRGFQPLPPEVLASGEPLPTPRDRSMRLATALPLLRVDAVLARDSKTGAPVGGEARVAPDPSSEVGLALAAAAVPSHVAPRDVGGTADAAARVLTGYLETMEEFLVTQEEVMRAFLQPEGAGTPVSIAEVTDAGGLLGAALPGPGPLDLAGVRPASSGASRRPEAPVRDATEDGAGQVRWQARGGAEEGLHGPNGQPCERLRVPFEEPREVPGGTSATGGVGPPGDDRPRGLWPLLGQAVIHRTGDEVRFRRTLGLDEERFLLDHPLGGRISADGTQKALPIFPVAMSLELMAEAALLVKPGGRLAGLRAVRAHRWLAFGEPQVTIEVSAGRRGGGEVEVRVHRILDSGAPEREPPIVEGIVVFQEGVPTPPAAAARELRGERRPRWTPDELYDDAEEHGMFHGPAFRGVVSIDRLGENGADATLRVLSRGGLLRSCPAPVFAMDPLLIDTAGQVLGYWNADHLDPAVVAFPTGLQELSLYAPPLPPGTQVRCRLRLLRLDERRIVSDIDVVGEDDRLLASLRGWEVRRCRLPETFYAFRRAPRDRLLAAPRPEIVPWDDVVCCRFELPDGFFEVDGGIWREAMAHLVLSPREKETWRTMGGSEKRRNEWLMGRVAAKDAARVLLAGRHGLRVYPADVAVEVDGHGCPVATGAWASQLAAPLLVSLAHSGRVAVAIAAEGSPGDGIGIDVEGMAQSSPELERAAFDDDERRLLDAMASDARAEWRLRLWCAKEAVGKALGRGLVGGPRDALVRMVDGGGTVGVVVAGELAKACPEIGVRPLTAHTEREGDVVVALARVRAGNGTRAAATPA